VRHLLQAPHRQLSPRCPPPQIRRARSSRCRSRSLPSTLTSWASPSRPWHGSSTPKTIVAAPKPLSSLQRVSSPSASGSSEASTASRPPVVATSASSPRPRQALPQLAISASSPSIPHHLLLTAVAQGCLGHEAAGLDSLWMRRARWRPRSTVPPSMSPIASAMDMHAATLLTSGKKCRDGGRCAGGATIDGGKGEPVRHRQLWEKNRQRRAVEREGR
jgi:hypothetical protein